MSLKFKGCGIPKERMLFSGRDLIKLIIPLFLQQALGVLVGTVDSMMVSHAGEAAVSGVSLVNSLDVVLIVFFSSMVGGGAVAVAQALGKKDAQAVCESAKQLLYITTSIATFITVTVLTFRGPLLGLLFGDVEADVMKSASDYFFYVALSFPLLAIIESVGGCFRASGNTRIALYISLMINLINVCGNAIFIYVFELGAKGAALATLMARLIGTVIMLVLVTNKKQTVHVENILRYKPNGAIIKKIVNIGIPNGIENTMFQFGKLLTQALISTMATGVIAANAVGNSICSFQYMTGTACSSAVIAVVGRCNGAGEKEQAKYYSKLMLAINYATLWAVIITTAIFLDPIVSLYNLSDSSREIAKQIIGYHMIVAAVIWPLGFMLPSVFRADGDVRYSLVVSMISMWTFRVAGSYVFALESVSVLKLFSFSGLGMGIMGVWVAMTVDWVCRSSLFLYHFIKKNRQKAAEKEATPCA
jgi:putative MATE family efflux protein